MGERSARQKIDEILNKINCHKVVLYLRGLIPYSELISHPKDESTDFTYSKKALAISDKEFTLVNSDEELRHLANLNCEAGKIYIGQIFNEGLAHSFMVGKWKGKINLFALIRPDLLKI